MKTYVLTLSRYFPKTHKRAGEQTHFVEMVENVTHPLLRCACGAKKHTIRQNFELWQKRISEIQKGNAILSIRYWSGKPYNSKQVEICQLNRFSGIGIEEVIFPCVENYSKIIEIAKNDGLSIEDFEEWFKKYDFSKSLAIIHFTAFRYFSYNAR